MAEYEEVCVDCRKPLSYEAEDGFVFWQGQKLLWVCRECDKVDEKISEYREDGG